jgi:hypothetical protein
MTRGAGAPLRRHLAAGDLIAYPAVEQVILIHRRMQIFGGVMQSLRGTWSAITAYATRALSEGGTWTVWCARGRARHRQAAPSSHGPSVQ